MNERLSFMAIECSHVIIISASFRNVLNGVVDSYHQKMVSPSQIYSLILLQSVETVKYENALVRDKRYRKEEARNPIKNLLCTECIMIRHYSFCM